MNRLLIIILLLSNSVFSQNYSSIKTTIDEYQKSKLFRNASWSITARYLDNGENIISHNSNLSLAPASNLKLLTTAAALDILGEDYTFRTKLYYDGEINKDGILNGNLYLVGGGDPTLGFELVDGSISLDKLMSKFYSAIKGKGIKSIVGNIIADDLLYDRIPIPNNWTWIDLGNYYAASASALTIHNNLYYLFFKPSMKTGDNAEVLRMEPEILGLTFENHMKTGAKGSGDNGYIFAAPNQYNAVLRGTIPKGKSEFSIKGSIPNPPLFASQYLLKTFIENGIKISGEATVIKKRIDYIESKKILENVSPPLKSIVFIVNKKSDNLYTEMLLRAIGLKAYGEGSVEKGIEAVKDFLKRNGIDAEELLMYDGCGLSRSNALTTNLMTMLLMNITKKKYYESFFNSLAFVGDKNDISSYSNYGIGTPIEKNAHIKSGVIEGVRAYSGYLNDKNNRTIVFSMIANNFNGNGSAVSNIHKEIMIKLAEIK